MKLRSGSYNSSSFLADSLLLKGGIIIKWLTPKNENEPKWNWRENITKRILNRNITFKRLKIQRAVSFVFICDYINVSINLDRWKPERRNVSHEKNVLALIFLTLFSIYKNYMRFSHTRRHTRRHIHTQTDRHTQTHTFCFI